MLQDPIQFAAGETKEFYEPGDFFRLMKTDAVVTIAFFYHGASIAKASSVGAGYSEKFNTKNFDRFQITSETAQTIQFAARLGSDVTYDTPPVGNVAVTNTPSVQVTNTPSVQVLTALNGAFSQAQATVYNFSTQLIADNAQRRYLLIQNKDNSGDIYVTLNGADATMANGLKIAAGGSIELQGYVPTGAVKAIGTLGNNANVVTVEG